MKNQDSVGKRPLIQSLERDIELRTEYLALLKLEHGSIHIEIVKALIDLSHTYIRNNSLPSALAHIERALRMNVNLSEILKQQEERMLLYDMPASNSRLSNRSNSSEDSVVFNLDDVKQECDSLSHSILLTIAICHLKMGNFRTSETLTFKVKQVYDDIVHNHSKEHQLDEYSIMLLICMIYIETNRYKEAEQILQEQWENTESLKGDHVLLVPVYLLLAKLYMNHAREMHTPQELIYKAIHCYEQALPLVIQHNHGYGMDRIIILFQLVTCYNLLHKYDHSVTYIKQVEKLASDIARDQLVSFGIHHNTNKHHLLHFLKWTCHVKMTLAFVYVKCNQYTEACRTLINVVLFNEQALNSNGRDDGNSDETSLDPPLPPPTEQQQEQVLNCLERADLYKKLGTIYMWLNQLDNASIMYRRALHLLYSYKRDNQTVSNSDCDIMIRDLLERTAKLTITICES
jgi:tetratricopeptide (TPR) repeat protein